MQLKHFDSRILSKCIVTFLCVWVIFPIAGWSAELAVSNRAPKPGEIDYRPADQSTTTFIPPSMIWLHESAAHRYAVQWARARDFSNATAVRDLPFNTYTHNAPLAPGEYFWRYRFTDSRGQTSQWSVVRSFTVSADAIKFPMPNRQEQRARVPEAHPRLFMRPEDLPRLREIVRGAEAKAFDELRRQADKFITDGPTPEPDKLGSSRDKNNKELIQYWWPNRVQAEKACSEAEVIAFVALITGEPKYRKAARRWVMHLASWDPDGPTNFRLNCEAAKPLLYRLPRAYDWAHDTLSPADREIVQKVMHRRAKDAWESGEIGRGVGHLTRPYNSHGNRIWHKLGECAIAFLGEIPEADAWLDYAVNKFYAAYPIWSDEDGGWHEGVSYWGGYMSKVVAWLQASRTALDIDGLQKPFFAHVGDFPLYVAPPHSPNSGFGDSSYRTPSASWGAFLDYFIRAEGNRPGGDRAAYWRWWSDQWNLQPEGGVMGFLQRTQLPPAPAAKPPADLPPSKVFQGIGVASLHTTLLDSRDDVHLLFKSSPFGTQSHGHNPHNTFQLNAYGDELLTTCVYRDLHGSKFHYQYAHSTVAHNGVLVNGQGQIMHTAAPHGRIVESRLTPEWDYLVGDATDAYGGRLERYQRHVLFLKPGLIVLYDDLVATNASTFQFMLHALTEFVVDEARASLEVTRPKAGVRVQYLSPAPLAFRQWDGYAPKPDREFPNQWHVEARTRDNRTALGMLTVLAPYRAGQKPDLACERLETDTALGARIRLGKEAVVVAFRKAGVKGQGTLAERKFDGPVMVKVE